MVRFFCFQGGAGAVGNQRQRPGFETMSFAIEAHQLRKEFGSNVAVADLTLQVRRGEIFAFLGPNGAGKTTSVKMLLGLVSPTSGQGLLLDRPVGSRSARAKVGYLPEHFRFHEWLTAAEFLDVHGKLYGMSKDDRRGVIPDLLELVGLSEQRDIKLKNFSKGMLQRIGIAQALINDPEIVFLDEPTSGLDPLGRRLVRQIIMGLRAEGTAVFLNSHLLGEVELTCDRATFIKNGSIVETVDLRRTPAAQLAVTLRIGQPGPAAARLLLTVGESLEFDETTGRYTLILPDEDSLPDLVNRLVADGHQLYEVTPQKLSLEDRFVRLMGD